MPVFALSKLAGMIGVKGGIILALLLALGFTAWRADVWHDRAEDRALALADEKKAHAQDVANERAAHAVTTASLENLQRTSAAFIAEGKRRTQAAERALERQESHGIM